MPPNGNSNKAQQVVFLVIKLHTIIRFYTNYKKVVIYFSQIIEG